jgi:hypothetical protein
MTVGRSSDDRLTALFCFSLSEQFLILLFPGSGRRQANIVFAYKTAFLGHMVPGARIWIGMPTPNGLSGGIARIERQVKGFLLFQNICSLSV